MKLYVFPTEEGAARAQVHGAREATGAEVLDAAMDLLAPASAWVVYDPEEGFSECATRAEADGAFDDVVEHYSDNADPWHDDVESIALYELRKVRGVRLDQVASADDDTEDGQWCRDRGWDFKADLVEVTDD